MSDAAVVAVVVTYNRKELLRECLKGLAAGSIIPDVIVVDNCSTDGTMELLSAGFTFPRKFTYERLNDNFGGTYAFAHGIQAALSGNYDWIWIMDDDAEPLPDSLSLLLSQARAMERYHRVAGVTPSKVNASSGDLELVHRGTLSKVLRPVPLPEEDYQQDVIAIDYSSFVGPLLKAEAIRFAGEPNRDYFTQYDDVEYSVRLREYGQLYLVTRAKILHKDVWNNESLGKTRQRTEIRHYWKEYYSFRNWVAFSCANGNRMQPLYVLYVALRRLLAIVLYDDFKWMRIRILLKSLMDGLLGRLGKKVNPVTWSANIRRITS